jgi:hypothetical protein
MGATGSGRPSAVIDTEANSTSVSFHDNGIHFAAGLDNGSLLIYDWRNTKEPLLHHEFGSTDPVRVKFQTPTAVISNTHCQSPNSVARVESIGDKVITRSSNSVVKDVPVQPTHEQNLPKRLDLETSFQAIPTKSSLFKEMSAINASQVLKPNPSQELRRTVDLIGNVNRKSTPGDIETTDPCTVESTTDKVRAAVRPVNASELKDAMTCLRYDIHREVQILLTEQVRQFELAKVNVMYDAVK